MKTVGKYSLAKTAPGREAAKEFLSASECYAAMLKDL
jgi:hypothetical protein